jgi:hypothetical protein
MTRLAEGVELETNILQAFPRNQANSLDPVVAISLIDQALVRARVKRE